jgi:uncharacterized protein
MKKVWIDITHPAQLNFYSAFIKSFSAQNEVYVTIIRRGKLEKITRKELTGYGNVFISVISVHKGYRLSIIWHANILRFFLLLRFYFKVRPDVSISNGFLAGIVSAIVRIPSLQFGDDPERFDFHLKRMFSTDLYYCIPGIANNKVKTLDVPKEWAYLSPKYWNPEPDELKEFGLKAKEYIFVREISSGTLNYASQQSNLIASISEQFPEEVDVVLSLEDKSTRAQYPVHWILLEEPVNSIHSLIYYSKILISSGDSMAREAAALGVPSIYCGTREMKANQFFIDHQILFKLTIDDIPNFILKVISDDLKFKEQMAFREDLSAKLVDVKTFLENKVLNYF